jgi:predicted RNase H-like nuclease (RuvC/YqgF family)
MWKTLSDWLFAFFNMSRELQEHRDTIRHLEKRLRDTEEAIKLLAQEQRHARELDSAEREKQILRLQNEAAKLKALPPLRGRKKR